MRRVMMILILIAATVLLTGCHDGYYSSGFGYGYSSDVLVYGGYGGHRDGHGYGRRHGGYGHHGRRDRHGGHRRGHH